MLSLQHINWFQANAQRQLIISPLTFLSFLISLALVDAQDQTLRSQLRPSRPAPITLLGRIKALFHSLIYEPATSGGAHAYIQTSSKEVQRDGESWFWRSKRRQLFRSEFTDAFRLRKRVLVAMSTVAVISGIFIATVVTWALRVWRNYEYPTWPSSTQKRDFLTK